MALSPEQRRVLRTILRVGREKGATPMEVKAAVETGLTETGLRNLNYGGGSSIGWRQETKSSYPNVNRRNVAQSVGRFFDEVQAQRGKYGSAGELAQAVQRSAYPGRYNQKSSEADALLKGKSGPYRSSVSNALSSSPGTDRTQLALSVLGFGSPGQSDPTDPLTMALQGAKRAATPASPATPQSGAAPMSTGEYPLGKRGKVIGTPYQGTHDKAFNQRGGSDNWQSENAVDVSIPVGTPVYAEEDGVLGNTGSLGSGGRFAGLRTNLIGKSNSYYYAHLSKLVVKQGQRVKKGQLLGYSGSANGVNHLHFAVERGDPRNYVR